MPYGLAKDIGGDSNSPAESDMESCVQQLKDKGYSEESAVRICKTTIQNKYRSHTR
jgi:DNA-binding transcriptional regulator YhcF (GntR family)